jgi:hypothetical protein
VTNLVDHARRELDLCGQTAEDPGYAASIVAAVAAFASYGHSGGSAEMAIRQLTALLNYQNLSPLTAAPEEWNDRTKMSGHPLWQSKRNPAAFSEDGGATYYLVNEDKATRQTYTSASASLWSALAFREETNP